MQENKVWMIYDARYRTNKNSASCLDIVETSESDAFISAKNFGGNCVIVETCIGEDNKISSQKILN